MKVPPIYARDAIRIATGLEHLHAMLDKTVADALREKMQADEDEIRRMLGYWVSGAEPVLVYGPGYELMGLSYADPPDRGMQAGMRPRLVVKAWQ